MTQNIRLTLLEFMHLNVSVTHNSPPRKRFFQLFCGYLIMASLNVLIIVFYTLFLMAIAREIAGLAAPTTPLWVLWQEKKSSRAVPISTSAIRAFLPTTTSMAAPPAPSDMTRPD